MKLAETVTFGGSGLDRAAQLRGNLTETDISEGQSIVIWRGKVLVVSKDNPTLAMLSCTQPVLADAPQIFLGRDDVTMLFASNFERRWPGDCALSGWMRSHRNGCFAFDGRGRRRGRKRHEQVARRSTLRS